MGLVLKRKRQECDICHHKTALEDTFVYNGKYYCMNCLYSLVLDMSESGNLNINFDNCEEDGIKIYF